MKNELYRGPKATSRGRGQPPKFAKPEDLQKCIDDYIEYLEETGKPPTIAGLAYYTGIDRSTIYNYNKKDKFFHTIKGFRDWIIMNYEEYSITNTSVAGVIFLLKNYGYSDKQEIEHSGRMTQVMIVDDIDKGLEELESGDEQEGDGDGE